MHKNVFNPITLLAFIILLVFSSCSGNKRYANNFKKKTRTERTSRSNSGKSNSKRSYTSSSAKRSGIVKTAKKYIGKPYVYGGKKPSSGFDCSGFTSHVYKENGVAVHGPSYKQAKQGRKKSLTQLKAGDLVFFGSGTKVTHVAIVANVSKGKIEVIHSTSSRGVVIDDIANSKYWKKRYLFGRDVL
jgi:cell wall-associated NlpC family hydrolase